MPPSTSTTGSRFGFLVASCKNVERLDLKQSSIKGLSYLRQLLRQMHLFRIISGLHPLPAFATLACEYCDSQRWRKNQAATIFSTTLGLTLFGTVSQAINRRKEPRARQPVRVRGRARVRVRMTRARGRHRTDLRLRVQHEVELEHFY